MLNRSESYLSSPQRQSICSLLNKVRDDYLATEWELVVLDSASRIGSIQYEPIFSGTKRPDFLFKDENGLSFVADITAVSDRCLHKRNPFAALQEEFWRQQRKLGILHGGFDLDVRGYPNNTFRGSGEKPRLKIPRISEFPTRIFNARFRAFMDLVRENPEVPSHYKIDEPDTLITFSYNPVRRGYGGGSYLSYDFAAVIDSNPVYNALCDKADQLKKSGHQGLKGIFLCDGGCRILHDKRSHSSSYSVHEVITHFLQQHKSISFVVTLTVESNPSSRTVSEVHIEHGLYSAQIPTESHDALQRFVERFAVTLPLPEESPVNAMLQLRRPAGMTGRHMGNLTMSGKIEMSARMLLEILAGQVTLEDFEAEYRMKPNENPFRLKLGQGRLISDVKIEKHPNKDDDRIIISFGEPDPAVWPFR